MSTAPGPGQGPPDRERQDQERQHGARLHQERLELLHWLDRLTDTPITVLAFVWLGLLVLDFTRGLSPALQLLSNVIWGVFVLDFLLSLVVAPDKRAYLRANWLTAVSLLLPALRVLRAVRALRTLRLLRATRSLNLLRLLTSLNRGVRALSRAARRRGVGYVSVLTLLLALAGAAGMLAFENGPASRAAGLTGYGPWLWWTAMLLTTMGSEYWPHTAEGRLLALLLALYAFAVFGYLTASIASFFVGRDQTAGQQGEEEAVPAQAALTRELAALRGELAALRAELGREKADPER